MWTTLTRRAAWSRTVPLLLIVTGLLLPSHRSLAASTRHATAHQQRMPSIAITTTSVAVPTRISAGLVALTLRNTGTDFGNADVGRLNAGVTRKQVSAGSQDPRGFERAARLVSFVGGVDGLPVGDRETVVLRLVPGSYILHVSTFSPADRTHLAFFTVVATAQAMPADPVSDATLRLSERGVALSPPLAAGQRTLKVVNSGVSPHNVMLFRVTAGKTAKDLLTAFTSPSNQRPSWVTGVGGLGPLGPHTMGWMLLHLTAGHYVALGVLGAGQPILGSFTVR